MKAIILLDLEPIINICENYEILKIFMIVRIVFQILRIAAVILLTISLMYSFVNAILNKNDEALYEALSTAVIKMGAIIILFLMPTFINTLTSLSGNNSYIHCWNEATSENVEIARANHQAKLEMQQAKADEVLQRMEEEQNRNNETGGATQNVNTSSRTSKMNPIINGVQRPLNEGECMEKTDNCFCPDTDVAKGFQFTMETETGRHFKWTSNDPDATRITVKCPGLEISKSVHKNAADSFEKAFKNICKLILKFSYDKDDLFIDGTIVRRTTSSRKTCSKHAYGIAIDINYNYEIQYKGETYRPYKSQGTNTRKEYDRFVAALGTENHRLNVNYIIWKYAFEPVGTFSWGGNWNDKSFDPMHYEYKG